MEFTKELVLQVNEIYHDIKGALYADKHIDIFDGELNRWDEIGKKLLLNHTEGRVLLDVGTGTGFVPLVLAPYLSKDDVFFLFRHFTKYFKCSKTKYRQSWSGLSISISKNERRYIHHNQRRISGFCYDQFSLASLT